MNDNGELTFTELSNATKGIVFPDLLTDAFHFKDASGLTLLSFNSIDDLPQFPNSLEINNATDNNIIFPDNQPIGINIKTSTDSYIECDSTNTLEKVRIMQDMEFAKGVKFATITIASDITLDSSHFLIRCATSGGNITVSLPSVLSNAGRQYKIIKVDALGTLFIDPFASERINGSSTTIGLTGLYNHITLISDGVSGWFTI